MITGVGTIVLFCRDTEISRRWYEKAGFAYTHGYEGMHWFSVGDSELMLHPDDEAGVGPSVPTIHFVVSDVDAAFKRVVDAGLEPFDHQQPGVELEGPVPRPWGVREFELIDPDGHRLAFTAPA